MFKRQKSEAKQQTGLHINLHGQLGGTFGPVLNTCSGTELAHAVDAWREDTSAWRSIEISYIARVFIGIYTSHYLAACLVRELKSASANFPPLPNRMLIKNCSVKLDRNGPVLSDGTRLHSVHLSFSVPSVTACRFWVLLLCFVCALRKQGSTSLVPAKVSTGTASANICSC